MPNLNTYRIPVIPGINDIPLEPNWNNNGRGPNGAYFTKKYNDLIYALGFLPPVVTDFSSTLPTTSYEVGIPIFGTPTSIAFSYMMQNSGNLSFMDLYLNDVKQNTNPLSPGQPFLYLVENLDGAPNRYMDVWTNEWKLLGEDQLGDPVGPYTYNITWSFRTIVGFSSSPSLTTFSDERFRMDNAQSVLYRPSTVIKPATASPEYIYIFLPRGKRLSNNGYAPYTSFRLNGFGVPFVLSTHEILRFGVNITYDVYRLPNPTSGQLTIQLS